ncbi:MAG: cytochrome c [Pseudomonadota bacterium]
MRALAVAALLTLYGASAEAEEALLAKGESVYKQFCSHCHGLDMKNPGTSSYDLRKWPRDAKETFVKSVMEGKGDMPAWGDILLPEELEAIWFYVATRGGKEPPPQASAGEG